MTLDHVRDYVSSATVDPMSLPDTTPGLFATRWVTHFCAPVFVFLSGVSASLAGRSMSRPALSRFLAVRGMWLIFLEWTVLRFAWMFNLDYHFPTYLGVIWAIGAAFLCLAGLIFLPRVWIAIFGLALILGHNAFDGLQSEHPIWAVLHSGKPIVIFGLPVLPYYALVPWIGVAATGYALGGHLRRKYAFGLLAIAAFVTLRFTNLYGDPAPWQPQRDALFTLFSFVNCTKYPPSLLYLLMTLGPALCLWAAFEKPRAWHKPFIVLGRVPLFYYIAHLYFIHAFVVLLYFAVGDFSNAQAVLHSAPFAYATPLPGYGFSLPVVYAVWLTVVLALYPACRWFGALKQRYPRGLLRYL